MWLSLVGILLSLFSIISNLIESDSDDRDFPCFDFSSQAFYPNSISINDSIPFAQIHHLELNCRIFPRAYENDEAKMEAQKQSKHTFVAAYELNVITQDNSRFNILYTKDLQSLSQEAKKLADILNVPFLFYEGNPVVLKE